MKELVNLFHHPLYKIICETSSYHTRSKRIFEWIEEQGYVIIKKDDLFKKAGHIVAEKLLKEKHNET